MACYISQPNSVVLEIPINPKGKGQECMDQVSQVLGIVEQDYFGLQYKGSRGETLWLNLRNRVDRQLVPPYRLKLKVKFFVQPHTLLQTSTRAQFYDQVKAELKCRQLLVESEEELKIIVALIAQADHGDFDSRTHQLNLYKPLLDGIATPSHELIQDIADIHEQMFGMTRECAQYKLLQEASKLQNYGVEYHEAAYGGDIINVGIGPTGVFLYNVNMELMEKLEYPMITKAEHIGKTCVFKVMNDNGIERDIVLKMNSQQSANATYRCITEMHSFFCCDTVHNEVSSQFSRDLKGTLASIFNEKTTLGRDYVFDIKRTSREAYDHARRVLYQPSLPLSDSLRSSRDMLVDKENIDCDMLSAEKKCQELEETLERIEDSLTCCVCRDGEISAALCPCGHLTCYDCATRLVECPLCRKKIEHVQKIFLPTVELGAGSTTCASSISLKTRPSPQRNIKLQSGKRKRKKRPLEDMDVAEQ